MQSSLRYSSHLPMLIKIMNKTEGDVLELGTGFFSTPFLHWYCSIYNRKIKSYETVLKYFEDSKQYKDYFHDVILLKSWDDLLVKKYDVVFVDHFPAERRVIEIKRFANFANFIVIHDTEKYAEKFYHYNKIWSLFKYVYHYEKVMPNTSIVSNFVDINLCLNK